MRSWPRNRLVTAFELLAALPAQKPGIPVAPLLSDLDIPRRTFFRLVADLRLAGVSIETTVREDGRMGYYVGGATIELMTRIGIT